MVIAVGLFVFVLVVILGAYWVLILAPEEKAARALRGRLKVKQTPRQASRLVKARERLSSVGAVERTLVRFGTVIDPLRETLARSGMPWTVGTLLLASVFVASVAATTVLQFSRSWILAAAAAGLVAMLPTAYVRWKATRRIAKFEEQFPDVIDLMARALRAGHALPTALQLAAEEAPDPVGAEFKLLADQQAFGMSLPDALKEFARRVPLIDAGFFVTAILTQREMGGNLAEVLSNLSSVIRERFKVKRQVLVVSAHGRITGFVLGCLPPVVAGILFIVAPAHMRLLIDDPIGRYMVMGGLGLQAIGVLWIRQVIRIEY